MFFTHAEKWEMPMKMGEIKEEGLFLNAAGDGPIRSDSNSKVSLLFEIKKNPIFKNSDF